MADSINSDKETAALRQRLIDTRTFAHDSDISCFAALDLAKPGAIELIPALVRAMRSNDPDWRFCATLGLITIGPAAIDAAQSVLSLLTDDDSRVRTIAAGAISTIGVPPTIAVPALIPLLRDKDSGVREMAALSIGNYGPPAANAIPALRANLIDSDYLVRRATVIALKSIGSATAFVVPDLIALLSDNDPTVCETVRETIAAFGKYTHIGEPYVHDDVLLAWFAGLTLADRLASLQVFWCIGMLEQTALMVCGDALGFAKVAGRLTGIKTAGLLADLPTSQSFIRHTLEELESMFNCAPFPLQAWANDEVRPDFRAERLRGNRPESQWTPRARRAWTYIDRFLEFKGIKPFIDEHSVDDFVKRL